MKNDFYAALILFMLNVVRPSASHSIPDIQKFSHRIVKLCSNSIHAMVVASSMLNPIPVLAFENRLQNLGFADGPKTRGPQPTTLGLNKAGLLRQCIKPSPNCFSTTPDVLLPDEDDDDTNLASGLVDVHTLPRWKYTDTKGNPDEAFNLIGQVLDAYEPGEQNIDGGGFKVITRDKDRRYYYIQYESLKRGYIDDLEIAVDKDGSIQVVSSSRLGYLDFQVNAKRLNYIAEKLKSLKVFDTSPITPKTHPVYFESNIIFDGPKLGLGKKNYD